MVMEDWELRQKQSLPLSAKIILSKMRIRQFYDYYNGEIYVSFSGGKDSNVLLDIVRQEYPNVPAVFIDTGLEYPEIREFVKTIKNVTWVKPAMNFKDVLEKYGYPLVSKEQAQCIREVQKGTTEYIESKRRGKVLGRNGRPVGAVSKKWQYLMDQKDIMISEKCCDVMKKRPAHAYEKETKRHPVIGTMAEDSRLRRQSLQKYGCNGFDMKNPHSRPISIWLEKDVWEYTKTKNLPYSKIYDMGYPRTGCMFCMFGVHLEKEPNRFQLMQKTHPKLYDYCMEKLGCRKALELLKVNH